MGLKAAATTVLTLALLGVSMLSGAAFAQSSPAVSIPPAFSLYLFGGSGGGPITYGWKFQPKTDLTITQLGFCDGAPYSTVGLDESHDVGIFDATGSLIVSATVPAGTGALLVDNFWYVAVPPTVLSGGRSTPSVPTCRCRGTTRSSPPTSRPAACRRSLSTPGSPGSRE